MLIHKNNNSLDLGYTGNQFTCHNKRKADKVIFAKLDRALVNHIWLNYFPKAKLSQPIIGPEHALIILDMTPSVS